MHYLETLKGKTIGIAGMGYLGSHIAVFLREKLGDSITIIELDKTNINDIVGKEFDYFINSAGNTGDFRTHILETIEGNINLTTFLLRNLNVKEGYVGISSTRVYGFSTDEAAVFEERSESQDDHLSVNYIYDGAKKLMESMLVNHSAKAKYNITVARLSNVYGRFRGELSDSTFLKILIRSGATGETLTTTQHPQSAKDYVFIDDVIDGILRVLTQGGNGEVYNIAFGASATLNEVGKLVGAHITYKKGQNPMYGKISIDKAQKELGFSPKVSLKQCIDNNLLITER